MPFSKRMVCFGLGEGSREAVDMERAAAVRKRTAERNVGLPIHRTRGRGEKRIPRHSSISLLQDDKVDAIIMGKILEAIRLQQFTRQFVPPDYD